MMMLLIQEPHSEDRWLGKGLNMPAPAYCAYITIMSLYSRCWSELELVQSNSRVKGKNNHEIHTLKIDCVGKGCAKQVMERITHTVLQSPKERSFLVGLSEAVRGEVFLCFRRASGTPQVFLSLYHARLLPLKGFYCSSYARVSLWIYTPRLASSAKKIHIG